MPTDIENTFGLELKKLRLEREISQENLAHSSSLDRTYISLLERGLRQPTLSTLFSLCTALNIKPSEFISKFEDDFFR